MKWNKQQVIFFLVLSALTTIVKIICAPQINLSGLSTVIAVALFAGLTIQDKPTAFLMPLLALFISDVAIQLLYSFNLFPFQGFYKWQFVNYSLFIIVTLIGLAFRNGKIAGMFASALIAPTLFFILSNFCVWVFSAQEIGYTKDFSGLMKCFAAGLPFYKNSLITTIVFLPIFIASYQLISNGKLSLKRA
jgi:hypothetical protein